MIAPLNFSSRIPLNVEIISREYCFKSDKGTSIMAFCWSFVEGFSYLGLGLDF